MLVVAVARLLQKTKKKFPRVVVMMMVTTEKTAKRRVVESKMKRLAEKRLRSSTARNTDGATHEPEPMPLEQTPSERRNSNRVNGSNKTDEHVIANSSWL